MDIVFEGFDYLFVFLTRFEPLQCDRWSAFRRPSRWVRGARDPDTDWFNLCMVLKLSGDEGIIGLSCQIEFDLRSLSILLTWKLEVLATELGYKTRRASVHRVLYWLHSPLRLFHSLHSTSKQGDISSIKFVLQPFALQPIVPNP